jgi:hypothetical protein
VPIATRTEVGVPLGGERSAQDCLRHLVPVASRHTLSTVARSTEESMSRLRGVLAALATPFTATGSVDEEALRRLVDRLIEDGVHAMIPCGSTGEFAALTHQERRRVTEIVIEQAAGRLSVVPQTGAMTTSEAIVHRHSIHRAPHRADHRRWSNGGYTRHHWTRVDNRHCAIPARPDRPIPGRLPVLNPHTSARSICRSDLPAIDHGAEAAATALKGRRPGCS